MAYINKYIRNSMIGILILSFLLMMGSIIYTGFIKKDEYIMNKIFDYSYESGFDYQVYVLPNSIYGDAEYLESSKMYMLPYTDYIDIQYKNRFSSEQPVDIQYTYTINTSVMSTVEIDDEDKILWNKREEVITASKNETNVKELDIKDTIKIDFIEYASFVKSIYQDLYINASSELIIDMVGTITILYDGNTVTKEFSPQLRIPLDKNAFEITSLNNINAVDSIEKEMVDKSIRTNTLIALASCTVVLISLLLFMLFRTKQKTELDPFDKLVSGIFKEYGNRLAQLKNSIPYQASMVITVTSIKDMVKIADEIGQPVFYYKVNEIDERKIEFYVFNDTRLYYMVLFGSMGESENDSEMVLVS
ncbi:MAG: hypothetical protein K0S76_1563 [Herbinix sp.]|nr:hypothetical protein [Herbinix sp.]